MYTLLIIYTYFKFYNAGVYSYTKLPLITYIAILLDRNPPLTKTYKFIEKIYTPYTTKNSC